MKKNYNLIGNSFTHLTGGNKGYSVHGKVSRFINWVFDRSAEETFYVDDSINSVFTTEDDSIKYAWILESKYVCKITDQIEDNPEKYLSKFKYIFTHNKKLLSIDPKFKWCPANGFWIKTPKLYDKTKMISFITSNKNFTEGHRERLKWVEKIGDQVDLYGRGFREIETKEEGLCDYMFSIVIENGFYESYFTEKILDCFATGTIPIYLGSPDIADYFNSYGILQLKDEFDVSEDLYYDRISAVKVNFERVRQYEVLEDFIYLNYLK